MRGGGRETNWQVDVVDKLSQGGSRLQCSILSKLWRLKNCEEHVPISADIYSPFAGLMFCQIEPVYLDSP